MTDMLTAKDVAALLGIGADSWRHRVNRHTAPEPDDYDMSAKGTVVNLWSRETIERYVAESNREARRAV